jgi:pyruvate ferredoxin oxidoreductase beta subunit
MAAEDDVEVVVVAGDGSTYDMGLAVTSGALFRGLDFWYFCYDNEAYGNTGMRMSSATPYGVRTPTTPRGDRAHTGTEHDKKDLFEIWRAHRPAYLATISPRYPVDLTNKFLKAKTLRGPKLFIAHAPCPTGWLYNPEETAEYAHLAVETGMFALKEAVEGRVTHTYIPHRRRPVDTYLLSRVRDDIGICSNRPATTPLCAICKSRLIATGPRSPRRLGPHTDEDHPTEGDAVCSGDAFMVAVARG